MVIQGGIERLVTQRNKACAKWRAKNVSLYGTTLPPDQFEYNRLQGLIQRAKNKELFGRTRTPEQHSRYQVYQVRHRISVIHKVLALYGNMCSCCGETNTTFLTIDHIDGQEKRVRGRWAGHELWSAALSTTYPNSQYRILCFNCNLSRGFFGYCPHRGNPPNITFCRSTEYSHEVKLQCIVAYGGQCVLCSEKRPEFLSIDHINGHGSRHRKLLGDMGGVRFYRWLRRNSWPKDDYQLLCFNCNCSKSRIV